jgi:hypothetical protein
MLTAAEMGWPELEDEPALILDFLRRRGHGRIMGIARGTGMLPNNVLDWLIALHKGGYVVKPNFNVGPVRRNQQYFLSKLAQRVWGKRLRRREVMERVDWAGLREFMLPVYVGLVKGNPWLVDQFEDAWQFAISEVCMWKIAQVDNIRWMNCALRRALLRWLGRGCGAHVRTFCDNPERRSGPGTYQWPENFDPEDKHNLGAEVAAEIAEEMGVDVEYLLSG